METRLPMVRRSIAMHISYGLVVERTSARLRWMVAFIVCAVAIGMGGASFPAAAQDVEGLSLNERGDGQGHVLRVQASETIAAYAMPQMESNQVEWTLYNTELSSSFEEFAPQGPIENYTKVRRNGHLVLRFDLEEDEDIHVSAYRDGASEDLLLSFANAGATHGASEEEARPSRGFASRPSGGEEDRSAARDRWRLDTIVIDPGHGGRDPGAVAHGLKEKNVVLDVALRLGDYLEENLDVEVVYTREDDRFVELEERGRIANEAGGKLFISLHANASSDPTTRGTETYFLGPHRTEEARRVMERENRVIRFESDPEQYESFDEDALARQSLLQSANMQHSQHLAGLVEEQFEERVQQDSRGVKQAGFYVLWGASMPAILVELGFLTNPRDARQFLGSEQGRVYLASGIFRAVREYKEQYEKGIDLAQTE